MFRRFIALLLAGSMLVNAGAALAAEAGGGPAAPEQLATTSGSVEISRNGSENPMVEVARSVMWGAVAGFVVGGAVALAAKDGSGESLRWGIQVQDGKLSPSPTALGAIEPVQGGARARLIGVRF